MPANATQKQLSYIKKLAEERGIPGDIGEIANNILPGYVYNLPHPSISDASRIINRLLEIPVKPNPQALAALDDLDNVLASNDSAVAVNPSDNWRWKPKPGSWIDNPPPATSPSGNQLWDLPPRDQKSSIVDIATVTATETVENLLTPQKIETLIKPLVETLIEKSLKSTAENIILNLLPTVPLTESQQSTDEILPPESQQIPSQVPAFINGDFYYDPQASRGILSALKLGKNFYLKGHTGCGKTQLVMQIHGKLNRKIQRINMDGDVTKRDFIGNMALIKSEDGTTVTRYVYGALPSAMLGGYTLLCDEFDKTPAHIAAVLHPVMESNGTLYIPDTGETIIARKGFLIAATANTGGKGDSQGVYTGAEVQNQASLDRFGIMIHMDYPPQTEEIKILITKFPQQNPQQIASLVNLATHVRSAFARQELGATLSTRKLIDLLDLMEDGFALNEALDFTFLNWLDDEDKQLATTFTDRLDIGDSK